MSTSTDELFDVERVTIDAGGKPAIQTHGRVTNHRDRAYLAGLCAAADRASSPARELAARCTTDEHGSIGLPADVTDDGPLSQTSKAKLLAVLRRRLSGRQP